MLMKGRLQDDASQICPQVVGGVPLDTVLGSGTVLREERRLLVSLTRKPADLAETNEKFNEPSTGCVVKPATDRRSGGKPPI